MVNVDSVYQKVLTLANKEQRGYITPQEFNLLADKAQLDILNDYFHKEKTSNLRPKNQEEGSDELDMVREKMNWLRQWTTLGTFSDTTENKSIIWPAQSLAANQRIYKLGTFSIDPSISAEDMVTVNGTTIRYAELTEVKHHDLKYILQSNILYPTPKRPIYVIPSGWYTDTSNTNTYNLHIDIFPQLTEGTQIRMEYWKKPASPNWGYVVANQKPLYNFNTSINFDLHPMEEEPLVMRILQLAGVTIEKPELVQTVMVDNQTTKQNQNT